MTTNAYKRSKKKKNKVLWPKMWYYESWLINAVSFCLIIFNTVPFFEKDTVRIANDNEKVIPKSKLFI